MFELVRMQVTGSQLNEICKMASLEGKSASTEKTERLFNDVVMEVMSNNSIQIYQKDKVGSVTTKFNHLITRTFEAGMIPIGSIEELQNYLKVYNLTDLLELRVEESRLVIKRETPSKRNSYIPLTAENFIGSLSGAKEMWENIEVGDSKVVNKKSGTEIKNYVDVEADVLKEVLVCGEVVKDKIYPFKLTATDFEISVGLENTGRIVNFPTVKKFVNGEVFLKLSNGLDNVVNNLSGGVRIYLDNNRPAIIVNNRPECKFQALLGFVK